MKGQDIIDYIKENKLEDAIVIVTGTIYHNGDHDCISTDEISLMKSSHFYDGKYQPALDLYIDDKLY